MALVCVRSSPCSVGSRPAVYVLLGGGAWVEEDQETYVGRARLIEHKVEIGARLGLYTTPIGTVGNDEPEVGTGVLVRIFGRHFLLTAGHCLDLPMARIALHVDTRGRANRFDAHVANTGRVYEPERGLDHGYVELSPVDAGSIESRGRSFLPHERLLVANSDTLRRDRSWLEIAGYPQALYHQDQVRGPIGVRLAHFAVAIAGLRDTPAWPWQESPLLGPNQVDVVAPGIQELEFADSPGVALETPRFEGASGCGIWHPGTRASERWSPAQMNLVGILVVGGQKQNWFYRISLIADHLKLIAKDHPELGEKIYECWDVLEFM